MRILRLPEVKEKTGKGRSSIYEDARRGIFPRPIQTGPKSVGWVDAEIDAWIKAKITERDGKGQVA